MRLLYEGEIYVRPDGEGVVLAPRSTDRLELSEALAMQFDEDARNRGWIGHARVKIEEIQHAQVRVSKVNAES